MKRLPTTSAKGTGLVRCGIYTRKSTSHNLDRELNSLEVQREACLKYIAAHAHEGWRAADTRYDDGGYTGANLERPAFQQLMADVAAHRLDVVVVYKVDRFSRSLLDFATVMHRLDQGRCAFVAVTQNFSTADAMGRLTLNMLMSFAEFEREMIAERTRDKIGAARRRGMWTGGSVPLGYRTEDRKLVPHAGEAAVVQQVFSQYLLLGSARAVAAELNRTGVKRRGRLRTDGLGRRARAWDKSDVLRMLTNVVYAGRIAAGSDVVDGAHTAIITPAVFDAVQTTLAAKRQERASVDRVVYPLRGRLRCGGCGMAMTPATAKRGDVSHRYYRCSTRDKQGIGACPVAPVRASMLEDAVVGEVAQAARDPAVLALVQDAVRARLEARRQALLDDRRGAEAEGLAPDAFARIDRTLAELGQRQRDAGWIAEALTRLDDVWAVMTPENRARLIAAVVTEVRFDPDGTASVTLVRVDG
jgi:DNA invertase Pin-like site-specific DNA recombinase